MIHGTMPMTYVHIGGPDEGLVIYLHHYIWLTNSRDPSGYYLWDENREAYVWTLGPPPSEAVSP